jgi:hypothetical protein
VFGGEQPVVNVQTRFRLLPTFPRAGTFLQALASTIYRMQRNANPIPSWDAFGRPQPAAVDPRTLARARSGGVYNHLISSKPAITMTGPSTLVTTRSTGTATWTSPILSGGAPTMRYRKAAWNGSFGSWVLSAAAHNSQGTLGRSQPRLRLLRVSAGSTGPAR